MIAVTLSHAGARNFGLNQQSQSLSIQSNQWLAIAIQTKSSDAKKIALADMRLSNYVNSQANRAQSLLNQVQSQEQRDHINGQMILAFGSAFFGVILGWVITQVLNVLRFKPPKPRSRSSLRML